ncbi:hypothetical protein GCM10023184_22280 [Flaviaesturariibacter amylovorans]|uniref:Lipoprotein n=1 Tax=Flaviaesturariibacter amylovorans TaxID=1084520 RepID=A0ABP8GWF9_9BACT
MLAAVAFTSCSPVQGTTSGDYYDPNDPYNNQTSMAPQRIWVEDPYRPGATMLVERDPFTGRYYPVAGGGYGAGAYRGGIYTTPAPYGYPRGRNRGYRNGGGRYQTAPPQRPSPAQQAQQEEQRKVNEQRREETRDRVFGQKQ